MDVSGLQASLERIILNPDYHAPLHLLKALRNGAVYGTKIRFPHALVTIFLFRSGSFREKLSLVLKATRQHARNLAVFAFIYKAILLGLAKMQGRRKKSSMDPFFAGLVGGWWVFGRRKSSVSQQIVIYIFARLVLGIANLAVQEGKGGKNVLVGARYGGGRQGSGRHAGFLGDALGLSKETREMVRRGAWPVFASLSWAGVMWMFEWYPDVLQPSLRSSMVYIYENADHWDSLRNFLIHNK